jgi:hypothetical protein
VKINYSLTPADFITQVEFEHRLLRLPFAGLSWGLWGVFFAALLLVSGDAFPNVLLVAIIAFIAFQVLASLQRRLWLRRTYSLEQLQGLAGEQQIEIAEEYLRETAPNRDVTWKWQGYSTVHDTPTHVFIKPTPINTVIVPHRAFSSDAARSECVSFVKTCIEKRTREDSNFKPSDP